MSTFRRRLTIMSSDSKYALVKCYNDTFDLSCLTDGIAEYKDTNGDTQYIAGSATGTINVYPDSEVKITKASGIEQVNGSQAIKSVESKGIPFMLHGAPATLTHIDINVADALFSVVPLNGWQTWVIDNLLLNNSSLTTLTQINATNRSWVKNMEITGCNELTTIKLHNYRLSGMTDQTNLLNNISLTDCAQLELLSVVGQAVSNAYNNLQTFTITNCPSLNKVALNGFQYIGANFDNSANFFAFLRSLPIRTNNDGEIYISYMGSSYTADNIIIDEVTMRQYLLNKGWTFAASQPSWANFN